MAEHLFRYAPEKKAFDSATAMGRHSNDVNILLGSMIQDLLGIISVPNMAIYLEPFLLEPFLNLLEILFCLPDYLHLSIRGVRAREGMGHGHPQKGNACL